MRSLEDGSLSLSEIVPAVVERFKKHDVPPSCPVVSLPLLSR